MISSLQWTMLAVAFACCATPVARPLRAQDIIRLEPLASATASSLHELGTIVDATMDDRQRIYILDSARPGIVIGDSALRPLGVFGRRGSGPGEFREPVSIGTLTDGRIAVLDRALARVTIFTVDDHEPILQPQRFVTINGPSEAMCVLGDNSFLIYGFTRGNRLHVVDTTGADLRSLAPPDEDLSPMAVRLLTKGRMACDLGRDEVLISSRFQPFVEAFRISTGVRVWASALTPFRGIMINDRGASVTISSGPAGFSLITSILDLADHRVFQTTYESRTDDVVEDSVATYVYSRSAEDWISPAFGTPLLYPLNDGLVLSVDERGPFQTTIGISRPLFLRDPRP